MSSICAFGRVRQFCRESVLLGSVVSGIYVFYMMFAYYQEAIYRLRHPLSGEKFVFCVFLVFLLCLGNTCFSLLLILTQHKGDFKRTVLVPAADMYLMKQVLLSSITYLGSMLCTNYALNHVSYPTQILVKSAKMVPIVLGGLFFFGRRYPLRDYVCVALVSVSLVIFQTFKSEGVGGGRAHANEPIGLFFLVLSLLCDGATGPRQDCLLKKKAHLGAQQMMLFTNLFASCFACVVWLAVEGMAPLRFLYDLEQQASFLEVYAPFFAFSVCGALGQVFIFQSLRSFGSLYTSLFTTLRKAASTVFSVYAFGHVLTGPQTVAIACIFATLLAQSMASQWAKAKAVEEAVTAGAHKGVRKRE